MRRNSLRGASLGFDIDMSDWMPSSGNQPTTNVPTTTSSTTTTQSSGSSWTPSYSSEKQQAKDAGDPSWWQQVSSSFSIGGGSDPSVDSASTWQGSDTGSDTPPVPVLVKTPTGVKAVTPDASPPSPPKRSPALIGLGGFAVVALFFWLFTKDDD